MLFSKMSSHIILQHLRVLFDKFRTVVLRFGTQSEVLHILGLLYDVVHLSKKGHYSTCLPIKFGKFCVV